MRERQQGGADSQLLISNCRCRMLQQLVLLPHKPLQAQMLLIGRDLEAQDDLYLCLHLFKAHAM